MHVFCFHIPAQLRDKLSPRKPFVSFLDMLSPGCYDVKSKRLDVSLNVLFNGVASYSIFLYLINQPRGENDDGDVLRPSPVHQLQPHSSAVDVTDQPHSSGQHLLPIVSLFS
jgi:hypothetical protein